MLLCHYIPSGMKISYIVPIPKPKDACAKAMSCDDFRAITISPIVSKVFEYCLLENYGDLLNSADNQFGFKKGLGCNHAIYSARTIVDRFTRNGSTVNLCAIDLSKAFDKVNLHALFIKLMRRNLPCELLNIIELLWSSCSTCVKWHDTLSACFSVNFRVRQGSVWAPLLFAIYVDDLANLCSPDKSWFIILYADDILLITSSIAELERLFHACESELTWLDMAVNYKKSCCLRIGPRCDAVCANLTSSTGRRLPWVSDLRYLGVTIVRARNFKNSIDAAKRSFYRSANSIFGKIGRIASEEVTLQLIYSKSVPALLYGLESCSLTKSQIASLDFVVNRFLMKLFRTNNITTINECRNYFGVELPSVLLLRRTDKFVHIIATADNYLLKLY